ncbi:hypothetical protein Val02_06110 [Virgisporangium aliadipatigenens]|uniref:GGDEF domain-containing protein n=1 Tax=Virgisporangium aliadipatigenens TaxID=741659 RepID=A0A8J3YGS2_9ACTN|nr:diguanylate cyclase [Virgisporangium aliadipatigenens]GIJ43725.1 hypothetical protein Val02_06110 [Virgisporangium aliadipatigenens]
MTARLPLVPRSPQIRRTAAEWRDMSGDQQDAASGQLITDSLTGAYSRALLAPRLAEELSRASRSSAGCALFLFDVDYFKSINDAYGHPRGDEVLRQLADRIRDLVRGYDVLFRYGGDEFVLLLPDTGKADAVRVAMRMVNGVKSTPFEGQPPLSVSVSLGVASFPDDALDADGLLATADRRNYLAKHRGRACAVADDVDSDARPTSSRMLERDLQLASVREYLTRLVIGDSGVLFVAGERGAGYTRFFEEVVRSGRLRGLQVIEAEDPDEVAVAGDQPALVVLDGEPDERIAAAVRRLSVAGVPAVGVVCRQPTGRRPDAVLDLPVHDTVELFAWSTAAIRVWLRTTLQGEPSAVLVDWLAARTNGLPARVARELERLTERGALIRDGDGWSVAAAVLHRGGRRRRTLPAPMTELLGRQHETAQVAQLMAERRLVTLVGPGGIGKTRLSLAVAAAVEASFDDGVVFVGLEAARTEDEVLMMTARALGVEETPAEPLRDSVVEHLIDRALLLVLDNFEQAHAAVDLLGDLLASAPLVKMLVSSRERLGLYGEHPYPVPPLSLPDPGTLRPTVAGAALAVAGSPALALFRARARAVAYDFAITADNLVTVVELCRRLDGLPLAIELAAAHSDVVTPEQMLEDLANRLDLPGAAPRGMPSRQRTLSGTIDWSFSLLDGVEQQLFVRLGAFHGGARLDAVAALAPDVEDLPKRLERLVDKSLVRVEPDEPEESRYTLLSTVHTYVAARLAEQDVDGAIRWAYAVHYTDLAERAGPELTGPRQAFWMGRLEREYHNLRAASDHLLTVPGGAAYAARLAVGLWRFWRNTGRLRQGREWLERLLSAPVALDDSPRARVLHAAAVLAAAQDDHTAAHDLAAHSLAYADAAGDRYAMAQAGNALGIAAMTAGDLERAREHFCDSLNVWQELDDRVGLAMAHGNLTMVALRLGLLDVARHHATHCLRLERAQGNLRGIMLGLLCLGEIEFSQEDTTTASACFEEARTLARGVGDVFGEAMALHQLGLVAHRSGDRAAAVRQVMAALVLRRDADDRGDLAESLETLADLVGVPQYAPRVAARLIGAAQALRDRYALPPGDATVLTRLGRLLAAEDLDAAVATGRAAPLDTIVDEALDALR